MSDTRRPDPALLEMAADIVSAYITRNAIPASELPALIKQTYASVARIVIAPAAPVVEPVREPPMPISKSVTDGYIICFEDNKRFKSMKRHLQAKFGLSPEQYRKKWGLPKDYPMVAHAYSQARSDLAKQTGLGVNHPGGRARRKSKEAS